MKAEAKVQDLQGRLKIAEQEKATAERAQKVSCMMMHFLVVKLCLLDNSMLRYGP